MIVERIIVGALATNCYIIACDGSTKAAVIDPGADGPVILEKLEQLDLQVELIINTHGHYDHTGADSELMKAQPVPVYIGAEDLNMLNDSSANLALFIGARDIRVESARSLREDQVLNLDDLEIRVIETPGHTRGSISLLIEDRLFTGDLLFQGSVGRTDFPGSSYSDLMMSLNKISHLPDSTLVYPGHGPATVLGEEKQTNPFLMEAAK